MIRVDAKPEPAYFDTLVRQKGQAFLAKTPKPTQKQWESHSYWRDILHDLHEQYGGICAYSCHWIAPDTGSPTVEHFLPKSSYPQKAYEWDNYRLVCSLLNTRKRTSEKILDPFQIQNGWFIVDFPSLLIKPEATLAQTAPDLFDSIYLTITLLKLNDEATCRKNRRRYVELYCNGQVPLEHLQKEAPFLALELERQDLARRESLLERMMFDM